MRISRDQMWMGMAREASKRSTCHRLNVGALLIHNNNVLSVGYNGPDSGEPHCQGNDCKLSEKGACVNAIHAEANALKRMPKGFVRGPDAIVLYVTHSPCPACAELIGKAKIDCVIYETPYRDTSSVDTLIDKYSVTVFRLTPSGYLMNHRTGQVYNVD